jgi:sugar phosphate isomerase/epimerase
MKRIMTFAAALLLTVGAWAQSGKIGASVGIAGGTTPEAMAKLKAAGIEYIEVTMNPFWRNKPENEVYIKAYEALKNIKDAGLTVWSVHLPFSKTLDISQIDPEKREESIRIMTEMIKLAGIFNPTCLVLHPGADTIKDPDTREERLKCSRNSIGRLAIVAKEIGAVLCIEDLPRTCPGRTADEMDYLTADIPNVKICFDTNHLLIDSHDEFFEKVGDRIFTLHVSDYDRVDEKHWLPFHEKGVVDWAAFNKNLKKIKYKGVFMFEVSGKHGTPEDLVKVYKKIRSF